MLKFLRLTFLAFWLLLVSCLLLLASPLLPFFKPTLQSLFEILFSRVAIIVLGMKIEYRGLEKLKLYSPCVIIANHQSTLDLVMCTAYFPSNVVYVGKHTVTYIPFFGQLIWLSGQLTIDRSNHEQALKTLAKAQEIFKKGKSIFIMPEGTCSWNKEMGPFKKGAFHIAQDAGVKVLPVVISAYNALNFNKLHSGKIIFEVLEPLAVPNKSDKQALEQFIAQTRELMANTISKISST